MKRINKVKKVTCLLLSVLAAAGAIGLTTAAQAEKRSANIRSRGIIDFENGTVVIDSHDLVYLAEEIDLLEDTYKTETVEALNQIGTYYKLDGTTTFNEDENTLPAANAKILPYEAITAGIANSQSVTTAVSADNLLSGMQAWVNGTMLTGTMPDNGTTGISGLTAGSSYTIPAGYTTGGTVTAASLEGQTSGTATAANLSAGVTAWVNGVKITGTGEDNNSYYAQGISDGRQGYYSQEQYDNHYNEGYNEGVNNAKPHEGDLIQQLTINIDSNWTQTCKIYMPVDHASKVVFKVECAYPDHFCNTGIVDDSVNKSYRFPLDGNAHTYEGTDITSIYK